MINSILVFRTSVSTIKDVERISTILNKCSQISTWNINLEDWEKVLRIECSENLKATDISVMLIYVFQNLNILK